jgi:hypothetical protein
LSRKILVLTLMMVLLLILSACARARIVAEMEINGLPIANDIKGILTGKIDGRDYLLISIFTQEKESITGISILDIQNRADPRQISFIRSPDNNIVTELALKDNVLFASGLSFLEIIDVSVPSFPREITRIDSIKSNTMAISGKYAYFNNQGNIAVADISTINHY